MSDVKIKLKKLIFELVESISDDVKLGFAVRKLVNEMSLLKKERKTEKSKETDKKERHSKKIKPMPEVGIPHSKASEESEFLKNEKVLKLFCDITSHLNGYSIEKIELILEAIEMNFIKEYQNDVLFSKDWEDSFDIYSKLQKMIIEGLFTDTDETGFPLGQKFCKIYLGDENKNRTLFNSQDICAYFLKNALETKLNIKK